MFVFLGGREVEGKGPSEYSSSCRSGWDFWSHSSHFLDVPPNSQYYPTVTVNINIDKSETSHIVPLVEECTLQPKN